MDSQRAQSTPREPSARPNRRVGVILAVIVEALQTIESRLDRFGVALESQAMFPIKAESLTSCDSDYPVGAFCGILQAW